MNLQMIEIFVFSWHLSDKQSASWLFAVSDMTCCLLKGTLSSCHLFCDCSGNESSESCR